jgi:hypothetical protein
MQFFTKGIECTFKLDALLTKDDALLKIACVFLILFHFTADLLFRDRELKCLSNASASQDAPLLAEASL